MAQENSIYQPTMTAQGEMVQPGVRAYRQQDSFGQAADVAQKALDGVADRGLQELDQDSRVWTANASSQADVAAQEMLTTKKQNAGDGAPNFKDDLMGDWKKYEDAQIEAAPNGRTKELLQTHFAAVRESLTDHADTFQNTEMNRWRGKQADDGVDADARLMSTQNAAQLDATVAASVGKWSSYYRDAQMDPGDKQKAIDTVREKLTNAANMRRIQLDPTAYLTANSAGRDPKVVAADPSAPLGIRNNNPGNIRAGDDWQGSTGQDAKGYVQFSTPEAGLRALGKNLLAQQDKHGLNTVQDIITKWAPPKGTDAAGNPETNDTGAYIGDVATAMGVKPDDKLDLKDPATMQSMMQAMIQHENGAQPYSKEQIAHGAGAALGNENLPPVKTTQDADGNTVTQNAGLTDGLRVQTGSTAFNLGTWEQQQKWINLAETEQRRVKEEKRQGVTEAGVLISSAKERMQAGLTLPDDEMSQITAKIAATGDPLTSKKWQDLQATQDLTKSMQQLSPASLSNVINTQLEPAAHRDGATEREAMQLEIGQKMLTTMSEKVKSDPLSWAAQTGMTVTPLDFNKPETLPQRVASAEAVATKYGIPVQNALFSQAEAQQLGTSLETMPDTQKLALGKIMQKGFGQYFSKAVGQFADKDPIFSQAAFLSGLSSANDGTALDILRGQTILKDQPELKPKAEDKAASLLKVGEAFEYMPQAVPGVVASADALYARRVGRVASFDQTAYETALNDVIGGTKDGRGGVGHINGKDYLVPQEFTEDNFERGIKSMTADELASMSVGGGHAIYGKNKTAVNGSELLRDATLRSVAYGQYALFDGDGKPVTSDKGPNGQFILQVDPTRLAAISQAANEREAQRQSDETRLRNANRGI